MIAAALGALRAGGQALVVSTTLLWATCTLASAERGINHPPRIRLHSRPGRARAFVEEDSGREVLFHGTTSTVKGPPWVPDSRHFSADISVAREDFEWMQRVGVNFLRLAIFWAGVEPLRGQYNETYLDEIERVVDLAAEHGVYVMLNGHQDGLSEFFCGEGWPGWAIRRIVPGSDEAIGVSNTWYTKLVKFVLERPVMGVLKLLGLDFFSPFKYYPFEPKTPFPGPVSQFDDEACATFAEHQYWNLTSCFYQEDTDTKYPGQSPEMTRFPTTQACGYFDHGLGWGEPTYEMSQAYQALYDNWDGIGDAFVDMWTHVGKRFRGRSEVIGYNLLNEPFAGDPWGGFLGLGNVLRYVPWPFNYGGNADRTNLQPLYARINHKLRAAEELGGARDPDVILFLDGVTWGDFGSGFSEPPGGPEFGNRTVVSFHYYDPPQGVPTKKLGALETVAAHWLEAVRLGTGVMMTESESIWAGNGGGNPNITESCDHFLVGWVDWAWKTFERHSPAEKNWVSQNALLWGSGKTGHGEGWSYSGDDVEKNPQPPAYYFRDLARTYPQKVSGRTQSFFYNGNSSDESREYARFELVYEVDVAKKPVAGLAPTLIFALPERYPGGANVTVFYNGEEDREGQFMRVEYRWDGSEEEKRWIKIYRQTQQSLSDSADSATVKVVVRRKQSVVRGSTLEEEEATAISV